MQQAPRVVDRGALDLFSFSIFNTFLINIVYYVSIVKEMEIYGEH
jgi:hypothetical protein